MGLFGFGKKKKQPRGPVHIEATEVQNNTRVDVVDPDPHESRVLQKYKTAIFWADVSTKGKIDEKALEKWKEDNGIDWKYSFRSHELEGCEVTPGIVCECAIYFDEADLFNKVLSSEALFPIDGKPFFEDSWVYSTALHEYETAWREERGLRPLTDDDYLYDLDDSYT